jgi:hypothetical protein
VGWCTLLAVIEILLEKRGELVTREELRQRLWSSDTLVDFDHSLNTQSRDCVGTLNLRLSHVFRVNEETTGLINGRKIASLPLDDVGFPEIGQITEGRPFRKNSCLTLAFNRSAPEVPVIPVIPFLVVLVLTGDTGAHASEWLKSACNQYKQRIECIRVLGITKIAAMAK